MSYRKSPARCAPQHAVAFMNGAGFEGFTGSLVVRGANFSFLFSSVMFTVRGGNALNALAAALSNDNVAVKILPLDLIRMIIFMATVSLVMSWLSKVLSENDSCFMQVEKPEGNTSISINHHWPVPAGFFWHMLWEWEGSAAYRNEATTLLFPVT